MLTTQPRPTYLRDYTPPDYLVDAVDLHFDLTEETTTVRSRMALRANHDHGIAPRPLILHGRQLELVELRLNGEELPVDCYAFDFETLTIPDVPEQFTLEVETRIKPQENTSLEGLYKSGSMFCTQCEAQGFRKITYYPDRPDIMARYSTTIVADKGRYPVLLSNGNPVRQGELPEGRHWVRWEDPFPKPSYLFALVAGDLRQVEDRFVTQSGREVTLRIYVEEDSLDKCDHAMASLKKAMRWDEDVFGCEYDLDMYMIVAVNDFNMGAMENKGLNIFNSACILARPETATDADYQRIESVIAHEYFHNWTGNRITCRDWFQLSLKEGLTVFRDQEFSSDMQSRAVQRIHDVRALRGAQFPEDAGPMAHPVRPESYIEISNFYTATVYNKGAEVVRMMQVLLGRDGFRKGMDLYFSRYDGRAVTTEDFVACMEEANSTDLQQFRRWYDQAGTPRVTATTAYNSAAKTCTLTIKQSCPPTPGQETKLPFHIPLAVGLLDEQGRDIPLQLEGDPGPAGKTRVLELRGEAESFRFINVPGRPVPSSLRGFSAPVKLDAGLSHRDLAFLFAYDSDEFNRWEAGQQLTVKTALRLIEAYGGGETMELDARLADAVEKVLSDPDVDKALVAEALTLPSETYLAECVEVIDVDAIYAVRKFLRRSLADRLRDRLLAVYEANQEQNAYSIEPHAVARRSLKNACLSYLMELDDSSMRERCVAQFRAAGNMTDTLAALRSLASCDCPERPEALEAFYERWRHDPLVVDKWFAIQATSDLPETLQEVKGLTGHPAFEIKNPNKVRAVLGAFCHRNPVRFHDVSGEGYEFLVEKVLELDRLNPSIAARLLTALARWRKYDSQRQVLMRAQLERVLHATNISKDSYEIASKSLA